MIGGSPRASKSTLQADEPRCCRLAALIEKRTFGLLEAGISLFPETQHWQNIPSGAIRQRTRVVGLNLAVADCALSPVWHGRQTIHEHAAALSDAIQPNRSCRLVECTKEPNPKQCGTTYF